MVPFDVGCPLQKIPDRLAVAARSLHSHCHLLEIGHIRNNVPIPEQQSDHLPAVPFRVCQNPRPSFLVAAARRCGGTACLRVERQTLRDQSALPNQRKMTTTPRL